MEINTIENIGLMLDCSRGAVPTVDTLKELIDLLSAMGYNRLELYTEDTYEIEGRPFFGYMRGRYSGEEIRTVDAYAKGKGIELVPCIQVLAHLEHIFRWDEFVPMRDCNDILLVDEPQTYALIEDMFKSAAQNFTSRSINIGCDEAHMVGLGKFLDKHGYQNRFEIINRHLLKVIDIAKKYGFTCAIWSDMFFRLAFNGEYYHTQDELPAEVIERIPKDVTLIYWDYYSVDIDHYKKMFASHNKTGNEIQFAGGAWKWTGLTPDNRYSMKCADAAVAAARENGIKTMMVTAWGDHGAEASPYSVAPALYYFARLCQGRSVSGADFENGFKNLTGVGFDDFLDIEEVNRFSWLESGRKPSAMRNFLYEDCFLGYNDRLITGKEARHFSETAEKLSQKLKDGKYGKYSYIFDSMLALTDVLELKADLGVRTRASYRSRDKLRLSKIAEDYQTTISRTMVFYNRFKKQWFRENKPFGFETHEYRFGSLIMRLYSCRNRILEYCDGKIDRIPELEEDIPPKV